MFIEDTGRIKASIHNCSGCALHNSGEARDPGCNVNGAWSPAVKAARQKVHGSSGGGVSRDHGRLHFHIICRFGQKRELPSKHWLSNNGVFGTSKYLCRSCLLCRVAEAIEACL